MGGFAAGRDCGYFEDIQKIRVAIGHLVRVEAQLTQPPKQISWGAAHQILTAAFARPNVPPLSR
jgi:hypothetical protein